MVTYSSADILAWFQYVPIYLLCMQSYLGQSEINMYLSSCGYVCIAQFDTQGNSFTMKLTK